MWDADEDCIRYVSKSGTLNMIDLWDFTIVHCDTPKELIMPVQSAYDSHCIDSGGPVSFVVDGAGRLWFTKDISGTFFDVTPPGISHVKQLVNAGWCDVEVLFIGIDDEGIGALFSFDVLSVSSRKITLGGSSVPAKIHVLIEPCELPSLFILVASTDGAIYEIKGTELNTLYQSASAHTTQQCSWIMEHGLGDSKTILLKSGNEIMLLSEDGTCNLLESKSFFSSARENDKTYLSPYKPQPRAKHICVLNHILMICDENYHVTFVDLEMNTSRPLDEHIHLVDIIPVGCKNYEALMIDREGQLYGIYRLYNDLTVKPIHIPNLQEDDKFSMQCAVKHGRQKGIIPSVVRNSVTQPQ